MASGILKFEAPENFNLLWFYDEFMKRKIKIANSEKGELVTIEKAENELQAIDYLENHEKLAVQLLFPNQAPDISHLKQINNDNDFSQFNIDEDLLEIEISNDELQRYGIVNVSSNQKPYFFHRTNAEYFASRFIFQIISKPKLSSTPEAVKLLIRLGTEIQDRTIEIFLENALEKSLKINCNKKMLNSVAKCIEDKLKLKNFDFLNNFIIYRRINITIFFLNAMSYCSRNQIFNILKQLESGPILQLDFLVKNRGLVESILKLIKKLEINDAKEYLKQKHRGRSILEICFCELPTNEEQLCEECFSSSELNNQKIAEINFEVYDQRSYVTKMFDYAREIFTKDEQKRLLNVLENPNPELNLSDMSSSFTKNHLEMILNHRWKILKELFSENDQDSLSIRQNIVTNFINMLLSVDCRTNQVGNDDECLVETFQWFQKTFSTAEFKDLINDCFMSTLKNIKSFETAQKFVSFASHHNNPLLVGKQIKNFNKICDFQILTISTIR